MNIQTSKITRHVFYIVLLCSTIITSAHAQLILTAPPREDTDQGEDLYGPLAEKLTSILGEPVVYEQPSGWFDYARNMRDGRYDIVFDGPHFAAWRVKHLKHIPIAALPGTLNFMLVTNKANESITDLRSLAGKRICGLLSPNLGTNLIYDSFKNPVIQPTIQEIKGGMKEVIQAFKRGECEAAILRDQAYLRLPEDYRKTLKVIIKTTPMPNQTITVSQKLKNNATKLAQFMTSKEGAIAADGILSRYSKKKKYFEKASQHSYDGIETLLEGVVFGW